jgi:iduronate 2-sulfatase
MKNTSSTKAFNLAFASLITVSSFSQKSEKRHVKPNVLFIAFDDLKPVLGCYGDKLIKTPNIDRIARNGTVFLSNYCQQAVSGPTRASIMTGMRPDYTGVYDLQTKMRDINPDILSLPQYFISQGYSTQGIGKVFDPRCVDNEDEPSWSVPYHKYDEISKYSDNKIGRAVSGSYLLPQTRGLINKYINEARENGLKGNEIAKYVAKRINPSSECMDVSDNSYYDGAIALSSKAILKELKSENKPFFFAVGFNKPHLPFVSPKKYWDLYNRDEMPLAEYQKPPVNGYAIAFNYGEMRAYTDVPPLGSFTDMQKGIGLVPIDKQKELIHGYYAAVSYIDAQLGILLNTLDSLGLTGNTIIVLWGDHGWHLGDHGQWCKHTNFEQATRSPLIISAPGINPSVTNSQSEFVDVFPTLCELAGVKIPSHLDGKSLVSVMKNPKASVKEISVSQYPRFNPENSGVQKTYAGAGDCMGYSIRSSRYRLTLWMKNNFRSSQPFDKELVIASELYDYEKDPNETINVADDIKYSVVREDMYAKMLNYLEDQRIKLNRK